MELNDHDRNAVNILCRMRKTEIAGHYICNHNLSIVIATAPLKSSVDNLSTRLACCFIPTYESLLVDLDDGRTTDPTVVCDFIALAMKNERNIIIYVTFKSAQKS